MSRNIILLLIFSLFLFSCSDFNKVVKSTDYEYKYKKALEYYELGEFSRANTLFQDLVHVYRGTSRGDELYYNYAKSLFEQMDYILAGHYFKSIVEQYPRSKYTEEAQFMVGYCFYNDSPNPKLDQTMSFKAIDALQLFKNLYPYSERISEADLLIDELREKIAYKSFLNARIYFDMGYYKAAVIALNNCLSEHQSTQYREDIRYMIFKSKYNLAVNSVQDKKRDRLNSARDEYFNFADEFPESKYIREVNRDFRQVSRLLGFDEVETEEDLEDTTMLNVN
jgi:outer membrane protein assembly factor BamD